MYGVGYIEGILIGVLLEWSLMNGYEVLLVYGIVEGDEVVLLKLVLCVLMLKDVLCINLYGGLEFGLVVKVILKGEVVVLIIVLLKCEWCCKGVVGVVLNFIDDLLFEVFWMWWCDLVKEVGVLLYVIFYDLVLCDMVWVWLVSCVEFSLFLGIGVRKFDVYGDVFF